MKSYSDDRKEFTVAALIADLPTILGATKQASEILGRSVDYDPQLAFELHNAIGKLEFFTEELWKNHGEEQRPRY